MSLAGLVEADDINDHAITTRLSTTSSRNYPLHEYSATGTSRDAMEYRVCWEDDALGEVYAHYNAKHLQLDFTACIAVIGILEHTAA